MKPRTQGVCGLVLVDRAARGTELLTTAHITADVLRKVRALNELALARGGHLRVGLEDHRGRRASNEELVGEAVERVGASGREVADCTTAAAFLGVKAPV